MKFFLDNMISPKFAAALRALDQDVVALRDHFPEDTPDAQWLRAMGDAGWVLLTVDRHILSRPQESQTFKQAGVTTFFFQRFFSTARFWDQAVFLIRRWPRFVDVANACTKGSCFKVQQNGRMTPLR